MASNFWNEDATSDSSQVLETPQALEDLSRAMRIGLDDEHYWSSSDGTDNRGVHRMGSARGYFDVESNLSRSGSSMTARFYIASDTSRLYAFPSSGSTMFLGGSSVPEINAQDFNKSRTASAYYPGQNVIWVQEAGKAQTDVVTSNISIFFANTYNSAPVVMVSCVTENTDAFAYIPLIDASGFTVNTITDSGTGAPNCEVHWLSTGTIVL